MGEYCVYEHVFPNNKRYIGLTKNPKARFSNGGKAYSSNDQMYHDIVKYGWDNIQHNIVESNLTRKEAQDLERALIEKYDTMITGYNKHPGGTTGVSLYCKHVNEMLKALKTIPERYGLEPFLKEAEELCEDESFAYQINLVDIVIRSEIDFYRTKMFADKAEESMIWFYYISNWIANPETSILKINPPKGVW